MRHDRRTLLAALGCSLPFGFFGGTRAAAPLVPPPSLGFRSFEDALRTEVDALQPSAGTRRSVRVEVGHSDLLLAGVQGCHNHRPFAGFPQGQLRIVRVGSGPGPNLGGVRLYVCTLDVVLTGDANDGPSRPFDFAAVPPAPVLSSGRI